MLTLPPSLRDLLKPGIEEVDAALVRVVVNGRTLRRVEKMYFRRFP